MFYRNSQKRIYLENVVYFVTFKTYDNFPYFQEEIFCDLFVEELLLCQKMKQFELHAFNVLYEHVHLLFQPMGKYNYSKIIQFLKRHSTRDINFVLNEGAIRESRLRGGGYEKYEQFVKKHDEKLVGLRNKFIEKYGLRQTEFPLFRWHKSFHDHIIRGERDFENHLLYTAYNHLKHGLPENWKYTSIS